MIGLNYEYEMKSYPISFLQKTILNKDCGLVWYCSFIAWTSTSWPCTIPHWQIRNCCWCSQEWIKTNKCSVGVHLVRCTNSASLPALAGVRHIGEDCGSRVAPSACGIAARAAPNCSVGVHPVRCTNSASIPALAGVRPIGEGCCTRRSQHYGTSPLRTLSSTTHHLYALAPLVRAYRWWERRQWSSFTPNECFWTAPFRAPSSTMRNTGTRSWE
jgi:hypothetical protein